MCAPADVQGISREPETSCEGLRLNAREIAEELRWFSGLRVDRDRGSYTGFMTVTLELPDESVERLRREAKRRGVTLAELVAEIAAQLPDDALAEEALERFVGSGDSHDSEWATRDIHTLRSELAQRRPSEPA